MDLVRCTKESTCIYNFPKCLASGDHKDAQTIVISTKLTVYFSFSWTGHPQLRLFITHGGLLSLQEATYHRVPVLGMPVSMEQNENMRMVEKEGWGHILYWEDLTNDNLRNRILQTMEDPM